MRLIHTLEDREAAHKKECNPADIQTASLENLGRYYTSSLSRCQEGRQHLELLLITRESKMQSGSSK